MAYHAGSSGLGIKEVPAWEGLGVASRELMQQIADSDFDPEIIIAVACGSPLLAGTLSYTTDVKLSDAINVEFYTDAAETLPGPALLELLLDIESISNRRLLVVDGVVDSSHTLYFVPDLLKNYGAEVRSTVFCGRSCSGITPDYVWKHTDDWIVFPWLAGPPARKSK